MYVKMNRIKLSILTQMLYVTSQHVLYIYIVENTEFRMSELHLFLAGEYMAKCLG